MPAPRHPVPARAGSTKSMHQPSALAQLLTDARIAALLAAPAPALVVDGGGELRFANLAGLSLLGARTLRAAIARGGEGLTPFAAAATRLITRLPPGGPAELERLAVAGSHEPVVFACARIALIDGSEAILFTGVDADAATAPALAAAVAPLIDAERDALALFDADGRRIHANPVAAVLLGPAPTLIEIVPAAAGALATARREGAAELAFGVLRILLRRLGTGIAPTILAVFTAPAGMEAAEAVPTATDAGSLMIAGAAEPIEPTARASRRPTRFVWQTDAHGRLTSVSPELAAVVGEEAGAIVDLDWKSAGDRLGIVNGEAAAAAVARQDTWSGVTVLWPLAARELMRPVDLAALPVFDRDRHFLGYRGFGVFREPVARPAAAQSPAGTGICAEAAPASDQKRTSERTGEPPSPPPPLALVKTPENVVRLRSGSAAGEPPRPALTSGERNAFREIARVIGARLKRVDTPTSASDAAPPVGESAAAKPGAISSSMRYLANGERAVLDRLPLGVLVHRGEHMLYANRTLLDWVGLASTGELADAGGLNRLFAGSPAFGPDEASDSGRPLVISGRGGEPIPIEARLLSVPWEGETALVYVLGRAGAGLDERMEAGELALREAEATARELRAILDTATDGIALIDRDGRVLGINRSAEALFGFDSSEIEGRSFTALFAPESYRAAADYLDGLAANGVASVLNDGREVIGRVREGGLIPLFMTIGRVGESRQKFCAVFRDITQWKRAEEELIHARRNAERANSAKSEFLAKISHEIRTPLNAIIGFSEVMMEERFGPIGNERYREYLKDIRASGEHLISLINDLLDLSKIEAGKLDLAFASVDLNDIASQCMAIMQPQANRERIIIRTALSPRLPPVVADARSIRQIVLNLLSNSIKFTAPGGQVIVSTTLTDAGEVHLRVRDTGIGMSEAEIKMALEPFRQLATSGRGGSGGTGLGLPLTKALTEANRASFSIKSTVNAGTLIEIAFPSTRVLAE